jgi:hypothetical protein
MKSPLASSENAPSGSILNVFDAVAFVMLPIIRA